MSAIALSALIALNLGAGSTRAEVVASVSLTPTSAVPGATVAVTASGLPPEICHLEPVYQTVLVAVTTYVPRYDEWGELVGYDQVITYVSETQLTGHRSVCVTNTADVSLEATRVRSDVLISSTGTLSSTFAVPTVPPGTYTVTVTPEYGTAASATLTVLDTIPPFITGLSTGSVNAAGWYGGGVIVSFSCFDADSGIHSCTDPVTITTEGADQSVTGTAVDNAGNSATFTVGDINIDNTPPTMNPRPSRTPDHGTWYTGSVTIGFECADALSGVRSCSDLVMLSSDGRGVQYRGDAFDRAGNGLTFVGTVNIDQTPPTITAPPNVVTGTAVGSCDATPTLGTPVAADNLGVVTVTNDAPATFAKGPTNVLWMATDPAGHSSTATQSVTVNDIEGPTIVAPPTVNSTATSAAGAVIDPATFGTPTTADNCPGAIATAVSGVPAGNVFPIGSTMITWTATDTSGNPRTARQTVTIAYGVCPLYDTTKAAKLGSTIAIKVQLCAGGTNLSSASLVPNATTVVKVGTATAPLAEDSGNANADQNFRYDPSMGGTGGYIYNLSTTGLSSGTWLMSFTVDGQTYSVPFQVR